MELARRARGLSQRDLAERVGVTAMAISKIETGQTSAPTPETLRSIAQATSFPSSFFERPTGDLPPPLYRKLSSLGRRRMDQIEALAQVYADAFVAVMDAARTKLPSTMAEIAEEATRLHYEPEAVAQLARRRLGLGADEPVDHLLSRVEQAGCGAVRIGAIEDPFDAFSVWRRGAATNSLPLLVMGREVEGVGDRLRFTAAHEIGHLVLHRDRTPPHDDAEIEADQFASAFLMPRDAITRDLRTVSLTPLGLAPLKAKWRVSLQALFMRAVRLGLVKSDREKRRFFQEVNRRGWRKREPVDIPLEAPVVLHMAFDRLVKKKGMAVDDVADLAGLTKADLLGVVAGFRVTNK